MITWEWLAGFIDGEGCFIFSRNRVSKQGIKYSPRFTISQANYEILVQIQKLTGGHVATHIAGKPERTKKWKDYWELICEGESVRTVLAKIIPLLRLKKRQALLVWHWSHMRHGRMVGQFSDRYYSRRELVLPLFVVAINHRGKGSIEHIKRLEKSCGVSLSDALIEAETAFALAQKSDSVNGSCDEYPAELESWLLQGSQPETP